ncbi:MAG: DUF4390 domain-containing protein [Gallionella sp.]
MTDFFTRYCRKLLNGLLRAVTCLWLLAATAYAEGISVNKAEVRLDEDGYHLSATYDISLTQVMQQALTRGIPLYFVGEFSLIRPRWYWLNDEVFRGEQTIKLSYNVLTRQYRISRGALFQNFTSFDDALNILARQSSTVIPPDLLKKEEGYIAEWTEWIKSESNFVAAVRLRLDDSQLPKLLQVNALSGSDWKLDSDWHQWEISPANMAVTDKTEAE